MKTWRELVILAALCLAAAVGTHFFHPRAPAWYLDSGPVAEDEITIAQIGEKWKGDVLWIDARSREQFEKKHVPGALLINEQERDQLLFESIAVLQDNKKPVVIYCDSKSCQSSRKIRQFLAERMAIEEIYVLHGGWELLSKSPFAQPQK